MIYFVRAGLTRVKIGSAGIVAKRIQTLQTGSADELVLLLELPGGLAEERALHERFAADRIRKDGEWFWLSAAIREFLWEHGYREAPPPVVMPDDVRAAICSYDTKRERLRALVEALAEKSTRIALTDNSDPSDRLIVDTVEVFLETESEPTDPDALQRLVWFYFAPPHAYARLATDARLARLNTAMRNAVGIEIGPRLDEPIPSHA